jgi:hypothetical protein
MEYLMFKTIFISDENKAELLLAVLTWLESDFRKRHCPERHFWHNRNFIMEAFNRNDAMIAVKNDREVVGYLIWAINGVTAEIDIVEVRQDCRRQGVYKLMQSEFLKKYDDICVLTSSVIPESQEIFVNAGWETVLDINQHKKFYKIVRPVLNAVDVLSDGHFIAICSEDFYKVQKNVGKYQASMKYFKVEIDEAGRLSVPIATPFNYEGYIAIYHDKALVAEGKAKYLFRSRKCFDNLLVIGTIDPQDPQLFLQTGFFHQRGNETGAEVSSGKRSLRSEKSPSREPGFFADYRQSTVEAPKGTIAKRSKVDTQEGDFATKK